MIESPSRMNIPRNDNNNCCVYTVCGRPVKYKRFGLTLLSSLALLWHPDIAEQNYYFAPAIVFICALILFWNFPIFVLFTNSRPLYYEDLFLQDTSVPLSGLTNKLREKFESRFQCVLIFTNSIFTAALADYWLYQFRGASEDMGNVSIIGMMGITGGIIKIFQLVNHTSGSILLYCTRKAIIEENANNKHSIELIEIAKSEKENIVIELNDPPTKGKKRIIKSKSDGQVNEASE